mmetsp:Transcript_115046/g.245742  ORF Transcript_115046/g.245742 Transcript_115046/m.245742 type:complete len:260 (-) Transcript_115046:1162-1941(-)
MRRTSFGLVARNLARRAPTPASLTGSRGVAKNLGRARPRRSLSAPNSISPVPRRSVVPPAGRRACSALRRTPLTRCAWINAYRASTPVTHRGLGVANLSVGAPHAPRSFAQSSARNAWMKCAAALAEGKACSATRRSLEIMRFAPSLANRESTPRIPMDCRGHAHLWVRSPWLERSSAPGPQTIASRPAAALQAANMACSATRRMRPGAVAWRVARQTWWEVRGAAKRSARAPRLTPAPLPARIATRRSAAVDPVAALA